MTKMMNQNMISCVAVGAITGAAVGGGIGGLAGGLIGGLVGGFVGGFVSRYDGFGNNVAGQCNY